MTLTMIREALVERLQDRLDAAKRADADAKKVHTEKERQALKAFRQVLRDAMKWDYAEARKKNFEAGLDYDRRPNCPKSEAAGIERQLRCVNLDTRKAAFRISPGSDLYNAVNWLPASERKKESLCQE